MKYYLLIKIPILAKTGRKLFQPSSFIYTGEEKMPFNKRHPVYRELFLNEFVIFL